MNRAWSNPPGPSLERSDACRLSGASPQAVNRAVERGELSAFVRTPRGGLLFFPEDVEKWAKRRAAQEEQR